MNALLLALVVGLAPITQEEAIAFHTAGLCSMMEPGNGITRADGDGWIVSMLPGPHRFYTVGGFSNLTMLDMTPGKAYAVHVSPGATLHWCPRFKPEGRDACGPVPAAFLYNAKKVGDATSASSAKAP